MAEALAFVSVAGNILQFIQLGATVLRQAKDIKRSADGSLKGHTDFNKIIADFDKCISSLSDIEDETFRDLLDECRRVAEELKDVLNKVQAKYRGHMWSSYRQAIANLWKQDRIAECERRLGQFKAQLSLRVQIFTKEDLSKLLEKSIEIEHTTKNTSLEVKEMTKTNSENFDRIFSSIEASRDAIMNRCDAGKLPRELIEELGELRNSLEKFLQMQNQPGSDQVDSSNAINIASTFLETLMYRGMGDREESIPKAHKRTYEWIVMESHGNLDAGQQCKYQEERRRMKEETTMTLAKMGLDPHEAAYSINTQQTSDSPTAYLQNWLRCGDGVFWIWGKPGCGKSTLMKAMLSSPTILKRLKAMLNDNTNTKRTKIASFFFFRPGMTLQKSKVGLLQSLLWQLLDKNKRAIDIIFSSTAQKHAIQRYQRLGSVEESIWDINELRAAFKRLRQCDPSDLYLHIDGIDEIDCKPMELVELLQELTRYPGVKILAAGRDHPEFAIMCPETQRLAMHDLTEIDIACFVVDKVNHLRNAWAADILEQPEDVMSLVKEILNAAQGVFLWVSIVLDSLTRGSLHFENFKQLQDRLKEYPKELDNLYDFLLKKIKPRYGHDASFWLLIVLHATQLSRERIDTVDLWLAEQLDTERPSTFLPSFTSNPRKALKSKQSMSDKTMKRIRAQCPHFLEFGPPSRCYKYITFAHRTVLDFLVQDNGRNRQVLQHRVAPNRCPLLSLSILYPKSTWFTSTTVINDPDALLRALEICYAGDGIASVLELWNFMLTASNDIPDLTSQTHQRINDLWSSSCPWLLQNSDGVILRQIRLKYSLPRVLASLWLRYSESRFPSLHAICEASEYCHLNTIERSEVVLSLVFRTLEDRFRNLVRRLRHFPDSLQIPNSSKVSLGDITHLFRAIFPQGLPQSSNFMLDRSLEHIRTYFLYEVFLCFFPNNGSGSNHHVCRLTGVLRLLQALLMQGSDPDTLCRNVKSDPDKSQLSIRALLSRLPKEVGEFELHRLVSEQYILALGAMVHILDCKNATAIIRPRIEHQEEDIGTDADTTSKILTELRKSSLALERR